jgi:sugar lactone lactonase YvrE
MSTIFQTGQGFVSELRDVFNRGAMRTALRPGLTGLCFALVLVLMSPAKILSAPLAKRLLAEEIVNPSAFYPEGPQLTPRGLLVSEMAKDRIVLLRDGHTAVMWSADGCGPTSIKQIPSGGYWILCCLGHQVVRVDSKFHVVQTFEYTMSGRRITWPNDASVDASGNVYLSSSGPFSLDAAPQGRVVFIDLKTGVPKDLVTGIRYSNGILVQEDRGRVLVAEMLNRRILAYPLLGPGLLGSPRTFFSFTEAPAVTSPYELSGPDGIAEFGDGDILVADYGNGRILLISGRGRFLDQILVQYRFVTNMAIAKDQRSVFVLMTESNASSDLHGMVQRFSVRSVRASR